IGEVGGHDVDVVGQFLPDAGDAGDLGLAAQFAFGADLAGHAGDFGGERVQLIDHGVDGVLELEDFAFDIDGDLAGEVAAGDGGRHLGDITHLASEVGAHGVDGVLELKDFAAHIDRDFAGQVAVGHGDGDIRDVADLIGKVVGHGIVFPGPTLFRAGDAGDLGLAAQFAFGADLAGDAGDL